MRVGNHGAEYPEETAAEGDTDEKLKPGVDCEHIVHAGRDEVGAVESFGPYVRRSCFSDSSQGALLADAARKTGVKKVAILAAADCAYCQSLRSAFTRSFNAGGGEITADIPTLLSDTDFGTIAATLAGKDYDAILVPNYERPSALLVSGLIDRGIKPKIWLGGDAWNGSGELFSKILAGRDTKALITAQWFNDPANPKSKAFVDRYKEKFGKTPVDSAALVYDGMTALLESILRAKSRTRQGVTEELGKLGVLSGITGSIGFRPDKATPDKSVTLLLVDHGTKKIFATSDSK